MMPFGCSFSYFYTLSEVTLHVDCVVLLSFMHRILILHHYALYNITILDVSILLQHHYPQRPHTSSTSLSLLDLCALSLTSSHPSVTSPPNPSSLLRLPAGSIYLKSGTGASRPPNDVIRAAIGGWLLLVCEVLCCLFFVLLLLLVWKEGTFLVFALQCCYHLFVFCYCFFIIDIAYFIHPSRIRFLCLFF